MPLGLLLLGYARYSLGQVLQERCRYFSSLAFQEILLDFECRVTRHFNANLLGKPGRRATNNARGLLQRAECFSSSVVVINMPRTLNFSIRRLVELLFLSLASPLLSLYFNRFPLGVKLLQGFFCSESTCLIDDRLNRFLTV